MERLELSIALPLTNQEQIYGFDCLIYYETKLSSRAKYIFDAVSLIGYESSTAANKISIDGDLILRQTYPFSVYGGYKNLYSNDPLYDVSQTTSARDVSIESIMRRYNSRNGKNVSALFLMFTQISDYIVTLAFHSNYQYVERRDNLNSNIPGEEERFFNASMTVRVPTQTIM